MQTLHQMLLASALALASAATSAQTFSVNPAVTTVTSGQSFSVSLDGVGFANGVQGGGFTLSFDPSVIQYVSTSFPSSWNFGLAPGTLNSMSTNLAQLSDVSFAVFPGPVTGPFTGATVNFLALQVGTSALTLSPSNIYDFSDAAANVLTPTLVHGVANVIAVPEPGTYALFIGGMAALGLVVRRRA